VRLHRPWRITAGESVKVQIAAGDPLCDAIMDSWYCRMIRIVSPRDGYLVLSVISGHEIPAFRIKLTGDGYGQESEKRRIRVTAGQETIGEVLLIDGPPLRETTLNTSIEPL